MKKRSVFAVALMWLAMDLGAQQDSAIDPTAERILRNACSYLTETPFFSLNAETWREHLLQDGQKVQFSRTMEMEVRRPDRLHAEIQSPHSQRAFWYDGQSLTVLDRKRNFFSKTAMPSTIDQAVDTARDQFGIDLPLIDLAISDPFTNAVARVQSAHYFGMAPAMGYNCHHLAFTQANIDWQVWIQDGPQPLIRKFVITHKNEPGSPEFTGLIRSWNLTDRISESTFVFEPPAGSAKIPMHYDSAKGLDGASLKPTGPAEPRSR